MEIQNDRSHLDRMSWIKELVRSEENMEENGVVEINDSIDQDRTILVETLNFLNQMKTEFIEASNAFNELKTSAIGRIKVYGIAKTPADFMLFRNGFKMIFSIKQPGQISIRFNFIGPSFIASQIPTAQTSTAPIMEEHVLESKPLAFGDYQWTFQGQPVRLASVVKFHLSLFVRESTK